MPEGVLKWYSENKGFGFIGRSGDRDVFVHVSDVKKCGLEGKLRENVSVSYDLEDTVKGPKAVNIKLTGDAP